MKECKACGTMNHDVAKVCNKCSHRLDELVETGIVKAENSTVQLLERVGITVLVLLSFAGLILCFQIFEYTPMAGLTVLIGYGLSGFVVFALLKGIAEIIKILEKIKESVKKEDQEV